MGLNPHVPLEGQLAQDRQDCPPWFKGGSSVQYAHGSGKEGSKLSSGSRSPEGGRDTRAVTPSSMTEKAALRASNAGEGIWGGSQAQA